MVVLASRKHYKRVTKNITSWLSYLLLSMPCSPLAMQYHPGGVSGSALILIPSDSGAISSACSLESREPLLSLGILGRPLTCLLSWSSRSLDCWCPAIRFCIRRRSMPSSNPPACMILLSMILYAPDLLITNPPPSSSPICANSYHAKSMLLPVSAWN